MNNTYDVNNQKPWPTASLYKNASMMNTSNYSNKLVTSNQTQQPVNNRTSSLYYIADIPIGLAKSLEGKYFVGMAEDLEFGNATNAWARLYNPPNSGVNLYVNVWTASDITSSPYRVQIYFNSTPPGIIQRSDSVTPANTALVPLSQPQAILEYAIGVRGIPQGGTKAFSRVGSAGTTINSEEQGKFIFPPGGSFLVFLSNPERPTLPAIGKIAFGWWEEPIQQ
jgi:hypothetical protein